MIEAIGGGQVAALLAPVFETGGWNDAVIRGSRYPGAGCVLI